MERVIVTVRRSEDARGRDLELPAELSADRLAEVIAQLLGWDSDRMGQFRRYQIEAFPCRNLEGRRLQPGDSLADADVWDGSLLVLHPLGVRPPLPGPGSIQEPTTLLTPLPAYPSFQPPLPVEPDLVDQLPSFSPVPSPVYPPPFPFGPVQPAQEPVLDASPEPVLPLLPPIAPAPSTSGESPVRRRRKLFDDLPAETQPIQPVDTGNLPPVIMEDWAGSQPQPIDIPPAEPTPPAEEQDQPVPRFTWKPLD